MTVGIVGPEKRKFTPESADALLQLTRQVLKGRGVRLAMSGDWLGGGVDLATRTVANELGIRYRGLPPSATEPISQRVWEEQNIAIVDACDEVVCFVLVTLPAAFIGRGKKPLRKFCSICWDAHYQCAGCWTVEQARLRGKRGRIIVVE